MVKAIDIIRLFGGTAAVSRFLSQYGIKISPQAVQYWKMSNRIPAKYVVLITDECRRRKFPVQPSDVRPDIFGYPSTGDIHEDKS